jgi:hypothetical protein
MKCPYCAGSAPLVTGEAIYPHRPDLFKKKFYLCKPCNAYVGCHSTGSGEKPLGRLANAELRREKQKVHAVIDPVWKSGNLSRKEVYAALAVFMGLQKHETHVGMFDIEQCKKAQQFTVRGFT